jgi:hypothetical protein
MKPSLELALKQKDILRAQTSHRIKHVFRGREALLFGRGLYWEIIWTKGFEIMKNRI